jgi:cytochrome c oxidase cbb3-type subunit 4
MDISIVDVHSVMTVIQFGVFLGIVWWAYGSVRKGRFDAAARIPLEDDEGPAADGSGQLVRRQGHE